MRIGMLGLLCVVGVTLPILAAESDSKALFAKHWQVAKEFTLAVAEAMPAEGYDFKPNPDELSFGQLWFTLPPRTQTVVRPPPERTHRHQCHLRALTHPQQTSRLLSSSSPFLLTRARR